MVTNWSHTLGAVASRGAGTEAVRAKAADAIKDDRLRLARIEREREAMKFAATDADAVKVAQTAVAAAERTRVAECGNGDPTPLPGMQAQARKSIGGVRRSRCASPCLCRMPSSLRNFEDKNRQRSDTVHACQQTSSLL
jgi:hypothetical protein